MPKTIFTGLQQLGVYKLRFCVDNKKIHSPDFSELAKSCG